MMNTVASFELVDLEQSLLSQFIDIEVPPRFWTFTFEIGATKAQYLLRPEYHDGLKAIISWCCQPMVLGPDQQVSKAPLRFVPTENLYQDDIYPNPFTSPESVEQVKGVAVTGLPGIGKTVFLRYIWTARVAQNLPTLLLEDPQGVFIWKDGAVFTIAMDRNTRFTLADLLPANTWCLVDSNRGVEDVPPQIYECGRFIVQAASPREKRFEWIKKVDTVTTVFGMRDWTEAEFIMSYQLRKYAVKPPLNQLLAFCKQFGGSARDAYRLAIEQTAHEAGIKDSVRRLSPESLSNIFAPDDIAKAIPTNDPHTLISVFPTGDDDRASLIIRPPSYHVSNIIINTMGEKQNEDIQQAFQRIMSLQGVIPKAIAGSYYNENFHMKLLQLPVHTYRVMVPTPSPRTPLAKTRTWHVENAEGEESLILQPNQNIKLYKKGYTILPLEPGTYYRPIAANFPTFDAFFAQSENHALVFQASVSERHDVKMEGLSWLLYNNVQTMEYFYVTPASIQYPTLLMPAYVPDDLLYSCSLPDRVHRLKVARGNNPGPVVLGIYHLHLDM